MFASKDIFLKSSGGGYQISRSVRLRASATAYLNRTNSSSVTNNKIFTYSLWVKRGSLGVTSSLLAGDNSTAIHYFGYGNSSAAADTLEFYDGQTAAWKIQTNAVYRDPSAYYHVILSVDTTQATAANRVRIYVNGVECSYATATYPAQNTVPNINVASMPLYIGRRSNASQWYFDGYLTEINFIDGQALTPSSFGETNAVTGVWQPKKYAGTYGTNGFYLNFSDNSNNTAATIGKDNSGNGNNWTPNNISVTAGVTYDSMLDVPTPYADGGNGRGNYAVGNPVYTDAAVSATYTNGNLTWSCPNTGSGKATISATTGKFYWEAIYLTNAFMTGVSDSASVGRYNNSILYQSDGTKGINGTFTSYGATYTTGDVIGVALDLDGGTVTFYKNNSSQGSISLSLASITNATAIVVGGGGFSNTGNWNFGQRPFSYTPPSGFVALNTQNLPTPTISNGASYMAATTYTGTGSALTVANTVGSASFQPDFVWVKGRSGATDHALYDAVRGVQLQLESNNNGAETTETTGLTAFGSTGFTVGALAQMNTNTATYVAWQWNAGGSTVTNTSGSISAQVRANPTAGCSIVTWTGGGSAGTIGHGLGVTPGMIIVKNRSGTQFWFVNHASISTTQNLYLNDTAAVQSDGIFTSRGATTFGVGTGVAGSATNYVAYCFAAVAGYSAFGSYAVNNSADGPFVYLGFRARWILFKNNGASTWNWMIVDTARDTINTVNSRLFPDLSNAESSTASPYLDITANGFKIRTTGGLFNTEGPVLYAAFAENPFKYALAR